MQRRCGGTVGPAEVVVAVRGDLLFRHDQAERRLEVLNGFTGAQAAQVLGNRGTSLWQVVLVNLAALGAEAEAVVLDFEEPDGLRLPGERLVEDEDRGLHPGIGIEDTGGQRDDV